MTDPMLEVRDLVVTFGRLPGLSGISFSVAPEERVVILGGSGSGKTTLLRAIAGLAPTAGGSIAIDGRLVTADPVERRGVVYLHQTPLLFPHLSVFENVAFPLRIRGVPAAECAATVRRLLDVMQLGDFAARAPHHLSGGQRHRVALARALAARPKVLLLDEPLSSLDPVLREDVRRALGSLQGIGGPAMVIVTHDLEDAAVLGDRIGVILDGRLAQLDAPEALFARPASLAVARLLGVPNEVPGHVADRRFESSLGSVAVDHGVPAGPAVAVFRGDALRFAADGALHGIVSACRHGPEHAVLSVRFGALHLAMRVAPAEAVAPGAPIRCMLDPSRVTLFPGSCDV